MSLILALAVLLALAACSAESSPDPAAPSPQATTSSTPVLPGVPTDQTERPDHVTGSGAQGTWALWLADSLRTMVESHDTVVVGTVTGIRGVVYHETPIGDMEISSPQTVYDVAVSRVIASPRIAEGQTIAVLQARGPLRDGSYFHYEGDDPIEVGTEYLLFLIDSLPLFGVDAFGGQPFMRFVIDDAGFIEPTRWSMPGVVAITGTTLEELEAAREDGRQVRRTTVDDVAPLILAAIAEGPLPTDEERLNVDPSVTLPLPNPYSGSEIILPKATPEPPEDDDGPDGEDAAEETASDDTS